MLAGGTAVSLAALVGRGGVAALSTVAVTMAAAGGYYVLGGRDSDVGAAVGGRADERQMSALTVACAVAGTAALVGAAAYWIVAACSGGAAWPAGVVGAAAIVGAVVHLVGSCDRDLGLRSPVRPDERQAANRVRTLAASGRWAGTAALVGYTVSLALGQSPWRFLPFVLAVAASFGVALVVAWTGERARG
jgi:hypothetical protein